MTNDFKPAKAGGNQPRLSKEEYAEKKRAEKEKVYQMIDDAAREIVSDPDKFKSFLDTQSRMDRYSAANALLIYSQYPQATQLKDFDDWGKDNVKITKGAKSISILEPVEYTRADGSPGISYNVKKVFDVTQTNGRKAPAVSANRDPKALITTMLDVSPVEVAATDELPYPNMAAFYNNEKQTLYVKRNVGDSVAVAQCVAQELGHAQLSINSESYSRRDMGFQAVCIGYMICKKYGVDTQNFAINRIPEGLASKEPKEIRAELSKIRNAMAEIHSHISDEMFRKKQERSKRSSIESAVEVVYESEPSSEEVVLDRLPLMDVIENGALLEALQKLNERERQIFLARTLEEEDFETLGAKFGLSYKGAAALYYRTIQKIRKSIVVGGDKG